MVKAFILGYGPGGATAQVNVFLKDSTGANTTSLGLDLTIGISDTEETVRATVTGLINAFCTTNGVTLPSTFEWITDQAGGSYEGTTKRSLAFPIFKSATVGSGVATFHLTADGTSGGTALFPTGPIQDSVNAFVSDAAASYQMSYAFSNGNKTVTVTANKLTTANILTGLLGQSAANGSVVKLSVFGY